MAELLARYNRWRDIYTQAGVPAWDYPEVSAGRLYFRHGYPHPDWYGFAISQDADDHFAVLKVSTERRNTPAEGVDTTFSSIREAGKYIIYNIGNFLRIERRLDPISWSFRDAGMSPEVEKVLISERYARYQLRESPETYFITGARGISWTNWLLTLSYDDVDRRLSDGLPMGLSEDNSVIRSRDDED
ncbi:hypothetical protein [Mycobacterium sp. SMC-4]|uniref:hypothetical protein n=1 Tax=Mycobacterium sp. SMC-4 TaxID=2857059 RepID=UPI003D041695